jgi:transcriptional regulator of NAD metabolism
LGFAAGDQGVIETVETEHKTLEELRASLELPPDAKRDKILEAIQTWKVSIEDIKAKGVGEGEKIKHEEKRPWWKFWGK